MPRTPINDYLSEMGPVVREHGGFIDKYIGDAIMALFENADSALWASVEMLRRLDGFNDREGRAERVKQPIRIGIGLNTGFIMLGMVGESDRIEGTVISDAVNLASRIEGLTKRFQAPLIISGATLRRLKNADKFGIRLLGRTRVKGKREQVTLYEVFDADDERLRQAKLASRQLFTKAVGCFVRGEYQQAEPLFRQCLEVAPTDLPAQNYLRICRQKTYTAAPDASNSSVDS